MIWQLAQEPDLTTDRRIQVVRIPLATNEANYSERAEAVRILLDLVQGEAAKQYLKDSWLSADADKKVDISHISSLIDLAKQEMLPTEIRNEVYKILWDLVAQFGSVKVDNI